MKSDLGLHALQSQVRPKPKELTDDEKKASDEALHAGANQPSLFATKALKISGSGTIRRIPNIKQVAEEKMTNKKTMTEQELREIISSVLNEIVENLKQQTSQGMEDRLAKIKAAHDARAAKVRAANAPEVDADLEEPATAKSVPPPLPAAAKKKMVAESGEALIRKLVKAVILAEIKKQG